jgi:hypothetical protein
MNLEEIGLKNYLKKIKMAIIYDVGSGLQLAYKNNY